MPKAPRGAAIALARRIAETPDSELRPTCWLWPFSIGTWGYGYVTLNTKMHLAHRAVWILRHGEIPPKTVVRHKCKSKHCCNPLHLETGSVLDNVLDRRRDGTEPHGESNYNAILSDQKAREIHALRKKGGGLREIAYQYGVTLPTARALCAGKTWKHLGLEPIVGKRVGMRTCVVEGVEYQSMRAASKQTGIGFSTIQRRLNRTPPPPGYYFLD